MTSKLTFVVCAALCAFAALALLLLGGDAGRTPPMLMSVSPVVSGHATRRPAHQEQQPLPTTAALPTLTPTTVKSSSSILTQLVEVEASLELLKVQNFHFQRTVPRAPASVVRPHHRPYTPPETRQPLQVSCPSAIRPDSFCVPNVGRDWDASKGHRVFPISYSLPLDEYIDVVPPKTKDCSMIIPRDKNTYKFTTHAGYVAEYASSYYCITYKKGGWDTLRHYEIIAAGCMPYIIDLDYIPEQTMVHYPKQLVMEARSLPGVSFDCRAIQVHIDHAVFPRERYLQLLRAVIAHARQHMTTLASAEYVMAAAGFEQVATMARKPRVLVIATAKKGAPLRAQGNYNSWFLFHGLRTLLGANAVDSHELSFLYEQPLEVMQKQRKQLYGLGFGYAYKLKRVDVNRSHLEEQIAAKQFDVVVYADPFSVASGRGGAARFWLFDHVAKALPKERIFFLHAPDLPYPNPNTVGYDVTKLYAMGTVLQREIPDCEYYVPPGRESEAMKRCVWYHNKNCFDDVNVAPTIEGNPVLKTRGEYPWAWPRIAPPAS
jgi:hypothetical protein